MNPDKDKLFNYFAETFILESWNNEPNCFKSQNPSMIDLILTNHKSDLSKIAVLETGIQDHHEIIFAILKYTFAKRPAKTIIPVEIWKTLIKKGLIVT